MNQIYNERVIINAKLGLNQDLITIQFTANYSDQISEIFDKGFQGLRLRLNNEIFHPLNKTLFILTNQASDEYNQAETVQDCLQIENNTSLVYFNLKNDIGQRDHIRLRINHLRQQIQGLQQQDQIIQYNPDIQKTFKIKVQEQERWGVVQFEFMCSGNEQTIFQLKKKALDLFHQNFPDIEFFVEYDYFIIQNDNMEYGIEQNNKLISDLFQMESQIELSLRMKCPIDIDVQQQFGKLFYKFVAFQQDIQHVFQQFYQFIQERGQVINEGQLQEIENKFIETSLEELQLSDEISQTKQDYFRRLARLAIDYVKKVTSKNVAINTVPHVCRGLRILTVFSRNLELNIALASSVTFGRIALSSTGYIIGGIALAAEIGYLIYHREKFTNKMFYMRMGAAVGKQVAATMAYSGGMLAGLKLGASMTLGMPTLMPIILGLILGVGLAFITLLCFEKALNYFWGSDNQIVADINFLNDHDKNKCYFSALETIGCQEVTLTSQIKKLRLQRLKELHPDRRDVQDTRDEFIQQYIAFEIVLRFREELQEQSQKLQTIQKVTKFSHKQKQIQFLKLTSINL
ncbi:hypothetical protein pb186bvf_002573 [Paramecium bursaria]